MLLATDLDGTFLAGDPAKRHQLYQLINLHPEIDLAFVTGRGLEYVLPLLSDPTIPTPDYIICDVGATVVDGETLHPIQPLQAEIEMKWPGEHQIEEMMGDFPEFIRQDVPQERRCSYFGESEHVSEKLHQIADELGCDLLYSAGRYLDFLPRGVNKGSTLLGLVEHLGLSVDEVLVAGDTLNDLSMYQFDFPGVCVGRSESDKKKCTKKTRTEKTRR